jgi:hypothetical protein
MTLACVAIVLAVIFSAVVVRLHWASTTPSRLKGMPRNAIWVPAPPAPLDLFPRGVWLGCWLDRERNVNRCKVTDYAGSSIFDEDFSPVIGPVPIAEEQLQLKEVGTMELWAYPEKDRRGVPIVRLKNGSILVPSRDVAELRARFVP